MVTEAVQVNQVTSHLDASLVYGSEPCLARQLRRPAPGHTHLLRTSHPGRGGALVGECFTCTDWTSDQLE